MKISINGESYTVPRAYEEKLMDDLLKEGKAEYGKLARAWRVGAQAVTRLVLAQMEGKAVEEARGKGAGKEDIKRLQEAFRPPKSDNDPNLHLAMIFSRILLEGLKHVELSIDTDQGTISAFHLDIKSAGAAGRQVDLDRDIRERQNNRPEVPGCGLQ